MNNEIHSINVDILILGDIDSTELNERISSVSLSESSLIVQRDCNDTLSEEDSDNIEPPSKKVLSCADDSKDDASSGIEFHSTPVSIQKQRKIGMRSTSVS